MGLAFLGISENPLLRNMSAKATSTRVANQEGSGDHQWNERKLGYTCTLGKVSDRR